MVVVNTLKEPKNKNFVFKIARVAIVSLVLLSTFLAQASACYTTCEKGCITGIVWKDLNMNGIQEKGERKMSEITVNVYNDEDKLMGTTKTVHGRYQFTVPANDEYYVEFVPPTGYVFSPQDVGTKKYDSDANTSTGKTIEFYVKRDTCYCYIDAGMYCEPTPEPASVGNYVWNDLNVNGIQDSDEAGIKGITVNLYKCTGELVETKLTDENGYYKFINLDAGSYYIEFVSPSGYVFTSTNSGDNVEKDSDALSSGKTECFVLSAGQCYSSVDAGLYNREEIPEFPTVAIPMVAIIGLAFVFGRRKE